MAGANTALAFGALLAGAVVIDYGVKNAKGALQSNQTSGGSASFSSGTPQKIGKFPSAVDPLPGSKGSRLDQGIDFTGSNFVSPWTGKVVYVNANDPGWRGGGYVAVQSQENPSFIYYLAEGITPLVRLGQSVMAGEQIALPKTNPYNGIVGNGEAGLANPASPSQPLAQAISNPAIMVEGFYHWLISLGGPTATSTSNAGFA